MVCSPTKFVLKGHGLSLIHFATLQRSSGDVVGFDKRRSGGGQRDPFESAGDAKSVPHARFGCRTVTISGLRFVSEDAAPKPGWSEKPRILPARTRLRCQLR